MGDHLSNQDSARFKIFSSMTEMPLSSACVCFSLVVSCVFVSGLLRRNMEVERRGKKASSARGQEKKIKTKKLIFIFFNIYKKYLNIDKLLKQLFKKYI